MASSFQTDSSSPSSRSTGFVATEDGKPISVEVKAFGAIFIVAWTLLLVFMFLTRRRQRVVRAEIERLEAAVEIELDSD
ncbi:MAG: hypothetical protein ABI895_24965 [Deltaproteobacteria bacterium]